MSAPLFLNNVSYPGLVSLSVPGDGSCLFHCILLAISQDYRLADYASRRTQVSTMRQELANLLITPVDPVNSPTTYYQKLLDGTAQVFAEQVPELGLVEMQKVLADPKQSVSYIFLELLSLIINKDIYILDRKIGGIYHTELEKYYQRAREQSIVLLHYSNHYELVGVKRATELTVLFESNDDFITLLRKL